VSVININSTNNSLRKSIKKKISKPFVGKKVALLKAAVTDLAEDIRIAEDELDIVLDQVEGLEKQKEDIKDDINNMSAEHESAVQQMTDQLDEQQIIREKEQEEADQQLEFVRKEMEENVRKLKVQANETHSDVWSELNNKLEAFKCAAKYENEKIAAEKDAVLEDKVQAVAVYDKERRSVRRLMKLSRKSMTRQIFGGQ